MMNMMFIILKYVCLVPAIVYTFSNITKGFRGHAISTKNLYLMAISISAYCLLEFGLGY